MKFWKKQIFSLLAALAVLLTLVPQRAEAASCGLSGAGSVRAGNTVTVTFSISGGDILGFEATSPMTAASSVWRDQSPSSAAAGRSR